MDYHQDRFVDHSLVITSNDKVLAVFPANEKGISIQSHGGLSYGGLIYTTKLRTKDVIDIFALICEYYKSQGYTELLYKVVPYIYHSYPASEMEYALFTVDSKLYRRDVSSTIDILNRPKLSKGRRWLLSRAKKMEITIEEASSFEEFFNEYNVHLEDKYQTNAVHTAEEMTLLQSRFPKNIKYIRANDQDGFLGGTILYYTDQVIHAQYIYFTDRGKEIGAFDLLMNTLLQQEHTQKYFDFGISTEQDGRYLNEGLLNFKESFGARATVCDFYKITL
jgi:hypothetical protein